MTYYEERQYVSALKYVEQASKIMPKCPLVIWDHASILDMLRREKAAIALWKKLIRRGGRSIAFDECGEGLRWPRSLINDCNYRIGKSYYDLGNERLARAFITKHLKGRQPGLRSLYEAKRVRKEFSGL
jgi:tetratricopeptide (TPR) repeat protein